MRQSFPHMLQITTEIAFNLDIVEHEHTCAAAFEYSLTDKNLFSCTEAVCSAYWL